MSAPPEVTAAFDAALPGHSGVEDWYGIGTDGDRWRTLWRGLGVVATPLAAGGWQVFARPSESIGGQGEDTGTDLTTAIRGAVAGAAKVVSRYAAKQARAAARRMARAAEAKAMAAGWTATPADAAMCSEADATTCAGVSPSYRTVHERCEVTDG